MLLKRSLDVSEHIAHSPPLPPVVYPYAKTAKWLFTLLTSHAGLEISVLFFLVRHTVYCIGLKYLYRNKVAYFDMHCIFV